MDYTDILRGSMLMLFIDDEPVAAATSHTVNFTTNTSEITIKESGLFPGVVAQSIGWTCSTENLATNGNISDLMALLQKAQNNQLVTLKFAPASNWNNGAGIIGQSGTAYEPGTAIASGKAILTSFSINAPAGDNASISAEFTGVGKLDQLTNSNNG